MQPQVTDEQLKSLKHFSFYLQSYGAETAYKEYYIESGNVYYLDTNFFNTIEELNNFLIKIVKIQKYKKIYLLADEFFEHKFQKLDIDFEKSKIIVTGENLVDKKSIELLGNNIESIFINSIRVDKLNYTEEIFSTIKKINQKFGVVFFGLSLLLLTQNKKIKILQFMLIDKKIQDIGLLEGKNKHWISFEFDGFQIEIFEYIQVENDLFVYEDVYKNTLLYDKLKYNVLDFDGLIMNPYLRLHNLKLKEEEIKFMFE
jgi:hypothetical protein